MKIFNFSPANPLRMIDTSDTNHGFDGNFSALQLLSYQNQRCYFQPWQTSDDIVLQIVSDFVPTDLEFKNVYTNELLGSTPWIEKPTIIIGQTFKVYEISYPVLNLPDGRYYAEFSYTNTDDFIVHNLLSEPFEVAIKHENTLYIQYKNSVNDWDIIFDTGIVFNFRTGCAIKDYNPGNIRDIYDDQPVNPTVLSAAPFRKFKFYVGLPNKPFVPDWVFDKINFIQSMDQVKYNNVFYTVMKESEYEVEREDSSNQITGSIDVVPTINNFNRYITSPDDNLNSFIPMQKLLTFENKGGDFSIAGYFDAFSVLEYFALNKRTPAGSTPFELKLGITPGGSEIGSFTPNNAKFIQECFYFFSQATTVYISGITAAFADIDIYLVYKQLNETPIDPGTINPIPVFVTPQNATWLYIENAATPGQFDIDFDISTGLGRPNTNWFNWAIADGRNGTTDMRGFVPIGVDPSDPKFDNPGDFFGSQTHQLTIPELAKHVHDFQGVTNPSGGGDGGRMSVSITRQTAETGGDVPHNNMQPSKAVYFVTKIA